MNNLKSAAPRIQKSLATQVVAAIAILALVGLPVFLVARDHLASPNLWFDESGQVFLSLGQHHYTAPNSPDGGWKNLMLIGRYMNGDPGGFTVLLRFWTDLFGYTPPAVRGLPFLFFLLTPIVIFVSARRFGTNPVIAAIAASAPLGFPVLLHYGTEVRAYSMETCAVTFLFFVPCWMADKPRTRTVVVLGCIGALLVTSRYTAFVAGFAACLTAALPIRPLRTSVLRAVRFGVPLLVTAVATYLIMTRYQYSSGGRLPAVFEPFMLIDKDAAARLALLRANFLEPGPLPITIYLLAAPLFAWLGPRSLIRLRSLIGKTFVTCALYVAVMVLASLTGKLPWAWPTRWAIGYQALSACCLGMIVVAVGTWLWQADADRLRKALAIAVMACVVGAWSRELRSAIRSEHPYYETIATHLQALARSPDAKSLRLFVQINATPTTRYVVEFGPLKGAFSYPKNFYFENQKDIDGKSPISAKDYDVIVLTHFQFVDAYRARVTGGTAAVDAEPPPSCLLLLKR